MNEISNIPEENEKTREELIEECLELGIPVTGNEDVDTLNLYLGSADDDEDDYDEDDDYYKDDEDEFDDDDDLLKDEPDEENIEDDFDFDEDDDLFEDDDEIPYN